MTKHLKNFLKYILPFLKWLVIAVVVGAIGGIVGTFFHKALDVVTHFRLENFWVIYFMPLAGLVIVFLYRLSSKKGDLDTNRVIRVVQQDDNVPFSMSPLIFISTVITQLCGASAGREGAALQLGGSIGYNVGRCFRLSKSDLHIITLCGMASVFSALFGTPLTASVFVLEFICVGSISYVGFLPCIISSLTSFFIATSFSVVPISFSLKVQDFSIQIIVKTIILAFLCAIVGMLFCIAIKKCNHYMKKFFKNPYYRMLFGSGVVILLTLLLKTTDYNGAGMEVVVRAISGDARYEAFIFKIIFTAISLAAGFKGGEIVPTMFIGATFGCVIGPILGLDPSFAAAIGLVALFCAVVNCPIASVMLALELFGANSILIFAVASGVSFMMSGYFGLYKSQKILFSKYADERIDISAK